MLRQYKEKEKNKNDEININYFCSSFLRSVFLCFMFQGFSSEVNRSRSRSICDDFEHHPSINGFYGLIAVSKEGIENIRAAEETNSTIEISADDCRILFSSFWLYDAREWEEEEENNDVSKLSILPFDIVDEKMTIEEAGQFLEEINFRELRYFATPDRKLVVCWIG